MKIAGGEKENKPNTEFSDECSCDERWYGGEERANDFDFAETNFLDDRIRNPIQVVRCESDGHQRVVVDQIHDL